MNVQRSNIAHHCRGDIESARNQTGQSRSLNGSSFPTRTVGAAISRPLQGVCVQPGICGNPGLRAAISRPYRADTLIRVLAKNRGCGRILSAPTIPYFLTAFANPSVWVMFISASTHITSTPNSFASACPRSKGSRNSAVDRASATPESTARMETLRQ